MTGNFAFACAYSATRQSIEVAHAWPRYAIQGRELLCSRRVFVWVLFEGGNKSRAGTIQGNTVI